MATLYPCNYLAAPPAVDIGINKNVNYIVKVAVINELNSDHLPVIVELVNEKLEKTK